MKNFVELRTAAGLGDRDNFCRETGLSERTLSSMDNDKAEPSPILLKYLRLMANGCHYCVMSKRANEPHQSEKPQEDQSQCQCNQQP